MFNLYQLSLINHFQLILNLVCVSIVNTFSKLVRASNYDFAFVNTNLGLKVRLLE